MPKYTVTWNDIYTVSATVEANDELDALEICLDLPKEKTQVEFIDCVDGSWSFERKENNA